MDCFKIERLNDLLHKMVDSQRINEHPIPITDVMAIREELVYISESIKQENKTLSQKINFIKNNMFTQIMDVYGVTQYRLNPFFTGQAIGLLDFLKYTFNQNNMWIYIHPLIIKSSQKLFNDGSYANAAEDAFIEINNRLKKIYLAINPQPNKIPDGVDLMNQMFSENSPVIQLNDLKTDTDKNTHNGLRFLLVGAMAALRNPKAHENITLSAEEAMRRLMFASSLMYQIDEAAQYSNISKV